MKKKIQASTDLAPVSVVMVSSGDMENSDIITIAWTGTINSEPPMVSVSVRRSRYSYELIEKTGEFVINLVTPELLEVCDKCGVVSGRTVDKFREFKLHKQGCGFVKAPAIEESPVGLECKVKGKVSLNTHVMFLAEIVGVTAKEEWLQSGKLVIPDGGLISYVQNRYLATGKTLGSYGFTAKRKN